MADPQDITTLLNVMQNGSLVRLEGGGAEGVWTHSVNCFYNQPLAVAIVKFT